VVGAAGLGDVRPPETEAKCEIVYDFCKHTIQKNSEDSIRIQ